MPDGKWLWPHEAPVRVDGPHMGELLEGMVGAVKRGTKAGLVSRFSPNIFRKDADGRMTLPRLPAILFHLPVVYQDVAGVDFVGYSQAESEMIFHPKHEGVVTSYDPETLTLTSEGENFADFERKVRPGDLVRRVVTGLHTRVAIVLSGVGLQLENDLSFQVGDQFEVHWPVDIREWFSSLHRASWKLDLYADPLAVYGSGLTIDELESQVRGLLTVGEGQYVFENYDCQLRQLDVVRDVEELLPETARMDWLMHYQLDLSFWLPELMSKAVPTIEVIGVKHGVDVDADGVSDVKGRFLQTEDESKVLQGW